MSKPRRWWQRLWGKQSSSKSETFSVDMGYSVQHVELADFLNAAGGTGAVPPDKAVEALVWKALQGNFQGKEVGTMSYFALDVP